MEKLKAKGLTSPYLKPFVVARVNYTRFSKATSFDFDETLDKIIASAQKFNVDQRQPTGRRQVRRRRTGRRGLNPSTPDPRSPIRRSPIRD